MMNFVKSGDNLTLAAPYDVLSGGGFKVGNVFGVAANDALSGADVECEVEGVYDLAKDASTFAQGDLAYWDDAAKKVTSTVGSNLLIGAVEVAAATGAAVVRVNLFGVPGFSGQAHGLKVAYAKYDFAWMAAPPARRRSATPSRSTLSCSAASWTPRPLSLPPERPRSRSAPLPVPGPPPSGCHCQGVARDERGGRPTAVATPFKMTAAGKINVTIATGPLTAGVIEVWVLYTTAAA